MSSIATGLRTAARGVVTAWKRLGVPDVRDYDGVLKHFAGLSAAQRLEQTAVHDPSLEITLVSQSNYLLFTPMLAEVAGSGLEAAHISVLEQPQAFAQALREFIGGRCGG